MGGFTNIRPIQGGSEFSNIRPIGQQQAAAPVKQQPDQSGVTWDKLTASYNPGAEDHNALVRFLDATGGAMLSAPGAIYHAFADPPTDQEQQEYQGHIESADSGNMAKDYVGRVLLGGERLLGKPVVEAGKAYADPNTRPTWEQVKSILPEALGTGTGTYVGTDVPARAIGSTVKGVMRAPGDVSTALDVKRVADADMIPYRQALASTGHDLLSKAADSAKQQLWEAHAKVSNRVGQLKADIANADTQASHGQPTIPAQDLIPLMDDLAQRYKAAGGAMPKFDSFLKRIPEMGPSLTFEEAAALRSEVGSAGAKAIDGTRDAGAMGELEQAFKKKLADRTNELGMSKQFGAYNALWSTLKKYESQGAMGQLLNAQDGYTFFNILRDAKNGAELARTVDSLKEFGLPKDFVQQLRTKNAPLHDYLRNATTNLGVSGRLKAIVRHPVAATVGYGVGHTVGGWPGGTLGAISGGQLADTASAIRTIRDAGGVPSRTGEMVEPAKVQPTGQPVARTAQPDARSVAQLTSDMRSLGYDAAEAKARAIKAIRKYPNDMKAATDAAIRGEEEKPLPPVSGGSQSATAWPSLEADRRATDMARAERDAGKLPQGVSYVQRAQQIKEALQRTTNVQAPRELPSGYKVESYPWHGKTEYLVHDAKGKVITDSHPNESAAIDAANKKLRGKD